MRGLGRDWGVSGDSPTLACLTWFWCMSSDKNTIDTRAWDPLKKERKTNNRNVVALPNVLILTQAYCGFSALYIMLLCIWGIFSNVEVRREASLSQQMHVQKQEGSKTHT